MSDTVQTCVVCPQQRKTDNGYLVCIRCSSNILRHLRELEDYVPTLSLERPVSPGEYISGSGFGSKSPANDAVILHTDPRSDYSDRDGTLTSELGAFSVVGTWARVVMEEHGGQASGFMAAVGLLRTQHDWITRQPWVDEYADELRQVHTSVRQLARDPIPRSVGRCIAVHSHGECHGQVYEMDDASGVRCSSCRRVYTGHDLARFNVAQEASG